MSLYMDNKLLIKRLDQTLEFVVTTPDGTTMDNFRQNNLDLWERDNQYLMAFKKLKDDKFIEEDPNAGGKIIYRATIVGSMFIGYEKQQVIDNSNEKRLAENMKWLLWGTWFAGILAALLLLWQVFVYFYPVHKDYPYWYWEKTPSQISKKS
jgi:hypothetical protein